MLTITHIFATTSAITITAITITTTKHKVLSTADTVFMFPGPLCPQFHTQFLLTMELYQPHLLVPGHFIDPIVCSETCGLQPHVVLELLSSGACRFMTALHFPESSGSVIHLHI